MIIDKLYIPKYFYYGIKSKKGSNNRMKIFGADIETVQGEPKLLTITSKLDIKAVEIIHTNKNKIMVQFLQYLYGNCLQGQTNNCFFHNLNHDLVALFYKDYSVLRNSTFTMQYGKHIEMEVFAGNTWFATVKFNDIKTKVHIIDSYRYVFTSLENIAKQLKFKYQKQGKPKFLGEKITPEIIEYAKYDTLAELELANWIMSNHTAYNVSHSVSLANLASEIFKTKFIPQKQVIKLPSALARNYAIRSYHGGRNGLYIDKKLPCIIPNVTELDIISSYPNAMQNMPNFINGEYKNVDYFDEKYSGVYRVVGDISSVKYPICFNDTFKPYNDKYKKEVLYLTGYDIRQAIKNHELKINDIRGVIFIPDEPIETSPLRNYALHFFEKKNSTPKTDSRYLIYKLLLNALYGKFFQRTEIVTYKLKDEKYIRESWFKAGGLFNPFIATMITSFARVELNKMEWKYKSIHSSTDSVKTKERINERNLPKGIGGITKEIFGDCLFFRNKLYIHFNNSIDTTNNIISFIKRKPENYKKAMVEKLCKVALHGFQGTPKDLINIYKTGDMKYIAKHMVRVREAIKSKTGLKALQFIEQERNLKL